MTPRLKVGYNNLELICEYEYIGKIFKMSFKNNWPQEKI